MVWTSSTSHGRRGRHRAGPRGERAAPPGRARGARARPALVGALAHPDQAARPPGSAPAAPERAGEQQALVEAALASRAPAPSGTGTSVASGGGRGTRAAMTAGQDAARAPRRRPSLSAATSAGAGPA